MTEKLTFSVYVPGINETCDFSVPADMSVRESVKLIKKLLMEEYWGNVPVSQSRGCLMKMSDATVLNDALSFAQLGVSSGERLILV